VDGKWQKRYGWQQLISHKFQQPLGKRSLASCEVPDLELFPAHYNVDTVTFHAGTGLTLTPYGTLLFSWLIRLGIIRQPKRWAGLLHKNSLRLERFGNGLSGIYVELTGLDKEQRPLKLCWELIAKENNGVHIPTLAAVALTRKLLAGGMVVKGAVSSMGLLTLDEYLTELATLKFTTHLQELYPLS